MGKGSLPYASELEHKNWWVLHINLMNTIALRAVTWPHGSYSSDRDELLIHKIHLLNHLLFIYSIIFCSYRYRTSASKVVRLSSTHTANNRFQMSPWYHPIPNPTGQSYIVAQSSIPFPSWAISLLSPMPARGTMSQTDWIRSFLDAGQSGVWWETHSTIEDFFNLCFRWVRQRRTL